MSDIFISYKGEDRETARKLAELFEQSGWTVWWDRELGAGVNYENVIRGELDKAKAVVVIWSKVSVDPAGDNAFFKSEARRGKRRGVLVPILIDHIDGANIPFEFGDFHAADFSAWDTSPEHEEAQRLLARVAELIQKSPAEVQPSAWQRTGYFYRRRRALVLALLALALLAPVGLLAVQRLYIPYKRLQAARLMADGTREAEQSNFDGAIGIYNEAILRYDAYPDVYYHRAQAYIANGEPEAALADFRKALELELGGPLRRKAGAYIAKLQAGALPPSAPMSAGSGGLGNVKAQAPPPNPNELAGGDNVPLEDQVKEMFSGNRDTRIEATTKLVIERKNDRRVVDMALAEAAAQHQNLNGVVNTLVLLENVDPAILKERRDELVRLFRLVEGNGDVTRKHIRRVEDILNR